jgi:hypothetical protein
MKTTLIVVAAMTLAATASAQVFVHDPQARAEKEQQLQILTDKVSGSAVHLSVEARPVSGAPYSGEAVTETVQVLADGNRIVRRTTARVYRDGKGRTRRETIGPDGQVTSILISDPSAGRTFVVDPGTNTVRHTGSAFYVASDSGSGTGSGSGSGSPRSGADGETARRTTGRADGREAWRAGRQVACGAEGGAAARSSVPHGRCNGCRARHLGHGIRHARGRGTDQGSPWPADRRRRCSDGHTHDDGHSCRRDRQRAADHRDLGGMVLAGPQDARDDEARRSPLRRDDLPADRHRPRRAEPVAVRSAGRCRCEVGRRPEASALEPGRAADDKAPQGSSAHARSGSRGRRPGGGR